MTRIALRAPGADLNDLDLIVSERVEPTAPAVAPPRADALANSVEEIRECLTEQIRRLAGVSEFDNKSLVTNCAHVALMLLRQLSFRYGRP
jgi:hypothetical protein